MAKAYQMPFKAITLVAGEDLSDKRYCAIAVNTNGEGVVATATTAGIGILADGVKLGQPATVTTDGAVYCVLGETVTAGDEVQAGADGKIVRLASGKKIGICLVGGNADGIGTVLLK